MKIVYYSPHPNIYLNIPAGPGVHMREMIHGFRQLGHEVLPFIMGGVDQQEVSGTTNETSGIKQKIKPFIPNLLWQSLKDRQLLKFDDHASAELEKFCLKEKPDLIYERAYYGMTSGVEVAKKLGIQHYLEMNAPYPEERVAMEGKSLFSAIAKKKEIQQLRDTDQIIVVSSALKDYVQRRFSGSEAKTTITPNAIRSDLQIPTEEAILKVKKELGITERKVIGFVGSIFPYHGVDQLIRAFEKCDRKSNELHLLVVGDGAILQELKDLANRLGIADQCTFTGKIPHTEVFNYIGAMDIAVMATSNWYGSPVKIFEYGIMGKTVVAPKVIPVTDVMVDGEDGVLVMPNETELASALAKCINNEDFAQKMAQTWQEKVKDKHTWLQMAQLVLGVKKNNTM